MEVIHTSPFTDTVVCKNGFPIAWNFNWLPRIRLLSQRRSPFEKELIRYDIQAGWYFLGKGMLSMMRMSSLQWCMTALVMLWGVYTMPLKARHLDRTGSC